MVFHVFAIARDRAVAQKSALPSAGQPESAGGAPVAFDHGPSASRLGFGLCNPHTSVAASCRAAFWRRNDRKRRLLFSQQFLNVIQTICQAVWCRSRYLPKTLFGLRTFL